MIIVTTDHIPGMRVSNVLGLVSGSTVRARNIGRDIVATFRNIVGGEVLEYTKLLAEGRLPGDLSADHKFSRLTVNEGRDTHTHVVVGGIKETAGSFIRPRKSILLKG